MVLHFEKTLKTSIQKKLRKSQKFARKISVAEFRYSQTIFLRFTVTLFHSKQRANEQKVTSNVQKVTSNEQKVTSNEQRAKSSASFSLWCQRRSSCWKYRKWCSYVKNCYHHAKMIERKTINFLVRPFVFQKFFYEVALVAVYCNCLISCLMIAWISAVKYYQYYCGYLLACGKRQLKHWTYHQVY